MNRHILTQIILAGCLAMIVSQAYGQQQARGVSFAPVIINLLLDDQLAGSLKREVKLAWSAPVTRTDASNLLFIDIDHYRLRYRKTGTPNYFYRMIPSSQLRATIQLRGEASDTFELSLQVIDSDGQQSVYTAPVEVDFAGVEN